MARVRDLPWDACLLEWNRDPAIAAQLRQELGRTPVGIFYFSDVPWIPLEIGRLNDCLLTRTHVASDLLDTIGLVVSQENSCRFCFAAQRALMLGLGTSRTRIDRLERDLLTAELPPADRLAIEFARSLVRANPLPSPDDCKPLLDAGFSEVEVREIVASIAIHVFFNRMSTLAALPPEPIEALPERWTVRLFAPLVRMQLRRWKKVKPPRLASTYTGPFAPALSALSDLHVGGVLQRFVERLWETPEISQRGKALVVAVIVRALGCRRGEVESLRLLSEAGIDEAAARGILDHLTAPELDAFERVALPFARETAWSPANQVPRLQQRAREVQQQLSPGEFTALLALCSVTNGVCRAGAVVRGPASATD